VTAFVIRRDSAGVWFVEQVDGEHLGRFKAVGPLRDSRGCVWPPWDWTETRRPAEVIAEIRNSYEMSAEDLAFHPPGPLEMLV
jgi:hypothetical protein